MQECTTGFSALAKHSGLCLHV